MKCQKPPIRPAGHRSIDLWDQRLLLLVKLLSCHHGGYALKPPIKFSRLASITMITGAVMSICSEEALKMKSQYPVSPRLASTANSEPENSEIA